MNLLILGCASGMPSPNRAHSCYLLDATAKSYLLDCGGGAASAMLRCKVDTSRISDIFISHTHADHVSGLPLFIQMEYLLNRTNPLTVHVPSEFERPLRLMLSGMYLYPEKVGQRFDLDVRVMDDGFAFDDGEIRLSAHQNSHLLGNGDLLDGKPYDNRMQCFRLSLRLADRRFAYSADIARLHDLTDIETDLDLLLTEGMHLDLGELPELLLEKRVNKCILTHLPEGFDRDGTLRYFEKAGFSNLDFAEEGRSFAI